VIDDAKIQLVYKALEKGIPLHDDQLYIDLLQVYPYYQQRLKDKQDQIARIKKSQVNS
jgi:hypothetical protein